MEYPGTKFRHPIRLAMLIIFITAFFVAAPVIILYTAGYRYDWQNGLLKETGAISIDVLPKNAGVYLNGIMLKSGMPVKLNNIAPASYSLRLTAAGYFDWTKNIEVKNKETTYIKEISLLKKTSPQMLIGGQINNLALSEDNNYILYSIGKSGSEELWLWSVRDKKSTFIQKLDMHETPALAWSNGSYAIAASGQPPYAKLLIINAQDPLSAYDLAKNSVSAILKYQWDEESGQLYFSTKNAIFSFSPASGQTNQISKNIYGDWYMIGGKLWTLQFNTTTKNFDVTKDALGSSSHFNSIATPAGSGSQSQWRLLAAHQDTALLKNADQPQMILMSPDRQYTVSGENFRISKFNDWWLIWTQWELWTYSQGQDPYLLNRSGEHLNDVFPLDQNNTLGLVWEKNATALYPYYLVSHELVPNQIDKAAADPDDKILYFTAKINDAYGIWELEY